jgi:hypothetical protein
MDVGDILRLASSSSSSTDSFVEWNDEASMTTLVWPNFEQARGDGSIESSPMIVLEGIVQFTYNGRHGSDPITFTVED